MEYKDKNKKNILINDKDRWFRDQINDYLSEDKYYWDYEDYGHNKHCECYICRPNDWATFEDEISYYKSQERELRFKKLFNEITTIRDFI